MGVPGFFQFLLKQYKKYGFVINKDKLQQICDQILLDEINNMDYFLIDANCLIHPVCFKVIAENPDSSDNDNLENKMMNAVLDYMDKIISYVNPKLAVYIAIDGVAPVAKIKQQRSRRFKSVADKMMWDRIKKKHNKPIHAHWNNNAITPGTEFMVKLNNKICEWAKTYKFPIIYSSCFTPAEGEHKLLQFIREKNENNSYLIYGLDADLIHLALSTNSEKIFLLREANEINRNESKEVLNYISIKIMRACIVNTMKEYLDKEVLNYNTLNNMNNNKLAGFQLDNNSIINDFIFMCYFLGNDFLPHIPSLDIHNGGIEYLIINYAKTMHQYIIENNTLEYIVDIKNMQINNKFLNEFLNKLASNEMKILSDNYNKPKRRMMCDGDLYEKEVFKIDNLQFKVEDPIMLGNGELSEYRLRYYSYYWGVEPDEVEEFSKKLVANYMVGIKWVTMYYFDKCPSWSWYYPFEHPPFISDIAKYNINLNKVKFDVGKPILPFMQLLAVLPPQSSFLIPNNLRKLMLDSRSSLAYAYPTDFSQDFINKHKHWMGIPNLPPLDLELLKHSYYKYQDELSKLELERNEIKDIIIFNYNGYKK